MKIQTSLLALLLVLPFASAEGQSDQEIDATQIVRDAMNHWRGVSSYTEMSMVIHRPDWARKMTMRAWTKAQIPLTCRTYRTNQA